MEEDPDREPDRERLRRENLKALGFLLGHLAVGVVGAVAFGALLLTSDAFGLAELIRQSDVGLLAGALLFFGLIVTFGALAMAMGIMSLRRRDSDDNEEN